MLIPLLRAIQAGVLAVVDGGLKDLLGSLALYASPEDLRQTVERLAADPQSVTRIGLSKARELALENRRERAVAGDRSALSKHLTVRRRPHLDPPLRLD